MACNYKNEAVECFLLPNQPDEGNFTSWVAYEAALDVYQCDHALALNDCEQWKQHEQIEDVHHKAKAAKIKAAAAKECQEAAEHMRKCPWLKEGGKAGLSIKCCKCCILKGKFDSYSLSLC